MRKFLIAAPLALATAAVLATPASAAPGSYNSAQISREISQLDSRIDRAQARRAISPREANQLHREVRQIRDLRAHYARGGFTRAELRTLNVRIDNVERKLRAERNDRDNRPGRNPYRR